MKIKLFTFPNMLTLCNLLCGAGAVVAALRYADLTLALLLISAAAVFDFFDGFAARLLKSFSPLGKELDSLADCISFGLAPSTVLWVMYNLSGCDDWWGYLVFLLAAFSALRLAKFNIDDRQSTQFIGLPTPAAALLVASIGYLMETGQYTTAGWTVILLALALCYFLVCNTPMFALKFKHYGFRGNEVRYLFLGAAAIALAGWQVMAVPFIIFGYIAVSVVMARSCFRRS